MHMSSNSKLFIDLKIQNDGDVYFDNKEQGKIISIGMIGNFKKKVSNVDLVEGLKFNLLSVLQLTDNNCSVCFDKNQDQENSINGNKKK